jgi:hypothetical protein
VKILSVRAGNFSAVATIAMFFYVTVVRLIDSYELNGG